MLAKFAMADKDPAKAEKLLGAQSKISVPKRSRPFEAERTS
jgi:hypothetical protein